MQSAQARWRRRRWRSESLHKATWRRCAPPSPPRSRSRRAARRRPANQYGSCSTIRKPARLRQGLKADVADVFAKPYSSRYTDIFSSSLIAQKLFHGDSRRKVLVLMSDMIEDNPPYKFDAMPWTKDTPARLLAELDAKRQIPDLDGVCIYVTGASASSAACA